MRACIAFFSLLFFCGATFAFSQTVSSADLSQGFAIDLLIENSSVPPGSVISLNDGKYRLSTIPYDSTVFGVTTENPAVVFKEVAREKKHSVLTFGKAIVRVSAINGAIKKGDLITTSSIPGVAQRATENGYTVGVAQEDYNSSDPNKTGTIYVTLHLNYGMVAGNIRENLLASLLQGARAPFSSPLNALRYVMAGLIAILSFAGGFWFFGRVSSRGVEAVGRNPLARKYILLSVVMNVFLTVVVMMFGVALAYIILII